MAFLPIDASPFGAAHCRPVVDRRETAMPTLMREERPVTDIPAADPEAAVEHFSRLLAFETDCWDVHTALEAQHPGFVVRWTSAARDSTPPATCRAR
jgi:hypothetical protein